MIDTNKYQTNIRLYPYFRMAAGSHAWISVFFLYMSSVLSMDAVIQLSAIYYLSVVLLEVPSGYFSDHIGRRTTLLLAALSLILAYSCFIVGSSFIWFACGQFFLAAGIALQSGTDTAFHYDSLKSLGREREYKIREARAEQWGLTMLAIATLSGGALGLIDLRLAYAFSLLGAIAMVLLAWRFSEPEYIDEEANRTGGFFKVLLSCFARLRDPVLLWIFLVMISLYSMAHIVFEIYQPYISLLNFSIFDANKYSSLVSGVVIAISMFGGALAARISVSWNAKLGLVGLFAVAAIIQLSIVGGMALFLHSSVLILISTRNFPMSLVHAPVNAAIAPRINSSQRATYLSLQGLSERLVFGIFLLVLSTGLQRGEPVTEPALATILNQSLICGVLVLGLMFLFSGRMRRIYAAPPSKQIG